jgi:hypothetical protein
LKNVLMTVKDRKKVQMKFQKHPQLKLQHSNLNHEDQEL